MGMKRLSTGEVGVPGTGDTVNAGGQKLYHNFIEVYGSFGDSRLLGIEKSGDEEFITIHPSSYYQTRNPNYYETSIATGSMHNINTRQLSNTVADIYLPEIINSYTGKPSSGSYAMLGDRIEIVDTNESWSIVPLRINASAGQKINGQNSYSANEDNLKLILTVIENNGIAQWSVKKQSVSVNNSGSLFSKDVVLTPNSTTLIPIIGNKSYDAMKLTVYLTEYSASLVNTVNWSMSEIFALVVDDEIYYSQNSVIETNKIADIDIVVDLGVITVLATPISSANRCSLSVKLTDAIKSQKPYKSPVRMSLPLAYGLGGWVSKSIDVNWSSKQYATKSFNVWWITKYVWNELPVKWSSGGKVATSKQVAWESKQYQSKNYEIEYNLRNSISDSVSINYITRQLVSPTIDIDWGISAHVTSNSVIDYSIRGNDAVLVDVNYSINDVVVKNSSIKYSITEQLSIDCNVDYGIQENTGSISSIVFDIQ